MGCPARRARPKPRITSADALRPHHKPRLLHHKTHARDPAGRAWSPGAYLHNVHAAMLRASQVNRAQVRRADPRLGSGCMVHARHSHECNECHESNGECISLLFPRNLTTSVQTALIKQTGPTNQFPAGTSLLSHQKPAVPQRQPDLGSHERDASKNPRKRGSLCKYLVARLESLLRPPWSDSPAPIQDRQVVGWRLARKSFCPLGKALRTLREVAGEDQRGGREQEQQASTSRRPG
jgi:hypothetical protein